MKRRLALLLTLCGLATAASGAIPGALQLLPADTIGFVTTTDWNKAKTAWEANNLGRLWNDPAMRPFRERFERRFREEVLEHAGKQLGVKLADYLALAQGQVTLAVLRGEWKPDADTTPPWVLLVDAGGKAAELQPLLEDAAKKLRAANKTVTTQKVRDVEFTTVVLDPADFDKLQKNPAKRGAKPAGAQDDDDDDDAGPKGKDKKPAKIELSFAQSGGALVVTTSPKATERILARLGGGSIEPIGSQDRLQSARQAVLKDGLVQGWIDVAPFLPDISQGLGGLLAMAGADPRKAVSATGVDAIQWAAVNLQEGPDGTTVHSAIGVPEARRTGIFKLIQAEVKDSSPPAFVPPDAVKFQRWRLNGQKFWKTLEDSLNQISPQLLGILKLGLDSAGQQDDPNFTFKGELIDRLGDDLITFEKAPKGRTLPELNNPPSLVLLSSPKPERLVNGLRALMLMGQMQGGAGGIEVREFLGRKIYSARMTAPGGRSTRTHMAAGTEYVAISSSATLVEEFLRHTEGSGKSLKDFPGLTAAAERIGGMSTGFFIFENQLESSRASWELLRQGGSLDRVMPPGTANLDTAKAIEEWADFSLLPDFEKVARYFTFGVMVGSSDAQAFHLKWFAPAARP